MAKKLNPDWKIPEHVAIIMDGNGRWAKKRNLPICGAGKDLPEASDYAVIETKNGKCGIISLCSSINDAARAGNPSSTLPGRPGLNPLRFSTVYHVSPEQMETLKEIAASTYIDGRRNRSRMGGYTPYAPEGCFGFGDYVFRVSDDWFGISCIVE